MATASTDKAADPATRARAATTPPARTARPSVDGQVVRISSDRAGPVHSLGLGDVAAPKLPASTGGDRRPDRLHRERAGGDETAGRRVDAGLGRPAQHGDEHDVGPDDDDLERRRQAPRRRQPPEPTGRPRGASTSVAGASAATADPATDVDRGDPDRHDQGQRPGGERVHRRGAQRQERAASTASGRPAGSSTCWISVNGAHRSEPAGRPVQEQTRTPSRARGTAPGRAGRARARRVPGRHCHSRHGTRNQQAGGGHDHRQGEHRPGRDPERDRHLLPSAGAAQRRSSRTSPVSAPSRRTVVRMVKTATQVKKIPVA